jgi:sec-independent protein translocase protein TatA
MWDIGPEKLLIILAVALLVVGPKKIPEISRSLGKALRGFRDSFSKGDDDEPARGDDEKADAGRREDG